jgi:diguanylate cyclase (GGDEF)-like protein
MKIKSIMVPAKINAAPESNFKQLLNEMLVNNHSCGLIGYGNKLHGMVVARDIMLMCQQSFNNESRFPSPELTVADVMHSKPFCLHQDTSVYEALVTAKVNQLKNLPVVDDDDNLVGIISQTELLNTYIDLMDLDQALRKTNKKLETLALEDALMKIGSRHAMEIDLKYKQAEAKRNKSSYAIALIDVDFFKNYNDHYGHQLGDKALQSVAKIIKKVKRKSDRVYRYGGEEILMIMNDIELEGATLAAERIRAAIEQAGIEHLGSKLNVLTVSIGLCSQKAGSWKDMVKAADVALYQAKQEGRNRVL